MSKYTSYVESLLKEASESTFVVTKKGVFNRAQVRNGKLVAMGDEIATLPRNGDMPSGSGMVAIQCAAGSYDDAKIVEKSDAGGKRYMVTDKSGKVLADLTGFK